jgi:osmotically-inducible protein OsmY
MKLKHLPAMVALIASPLVLLAAPADDRKIEAAAHASYNFRSVLEDRVKAKADQGVVTLSGSVADEADRKLAADTVSNLPGVSGVRNELNVMPDYPERSDGWIALKIRARLLVKANVSATATTVAVKDGIVTLGGLVENAAQKELTEAYAKDIDGVKAVKNELVIAPAQAADKSSLAEAIDDASITTQVKYALMSHKATSALNAKVTTKDGVVHITGIAHSDAEKSLVTKLAQDARGTKSVKNDMTVEKS